MAVKALQKLDKINLHLVSKVVLWWVKRKKYEKHKYDFMVRATIIEILLYVVWVIVMVGMGLIKHDWALVAINMFFLFIMIGVEYMFYQVVWETKLEYDFIFAHRKHPQLHEQMKKMLEDHFATSFDRRKLMMILDVVLVLMAIINPFLWIIILMGLFKTYIHYVFDFDEPDGQRKEVKDSITDIVKQAFQRLVERVIPNPNANPI